MNNIFNSNTLNAIVFKLHITYSTVKLKKKKLVVLRSGNKEWVYVTRKKFLGVIDVQRSNIDNVENCSKA